MTEAPPDERAYMQGLCVVNSNDGWRIKRETPGPFCTLVPCRGCLHSCLLVFPVMSRMMSLSPLFLQIPVSFPPFTKFFFPSFSSLSSLH